MSADLCAHAELWSAIAGGVGSLLLAMTCFVEWGHRRKRKDRLKSQRRPARAGRDPSIDALIIEGSTEAVLGSRRFLAVGIGALFLVLSFTLLIHFSLACGR